MVFTVISKATVIYGKGKYISKYRYEIFNGVKMFFYDWELVKLEFNNIGLFEIVKVNENYPVFLIECKKEI